MIESNSITVCHRGCGLMATYVNWRGFHCCFESAQSCPVVKQKIGQNSGATRRATKCLRTLEHKIEQSKRIKEQWATGKRKVTTKQIELARALTSTRTGIPWNKGLTKDDPRVAKYATKQAGVKKTTQPKIVLSDDPVYNDIKKYRNRIAVLTTKVYNEFKNEINPMGLVLGKAGVIGAHQIDHIMSVREGFTYSVPIYLIASKENLRVIPWRDNISKYSKVDYSIVPNSIAQYLTEHKGK